DRYSDTTDPALAEQVAKALRGKGSILEDKGQPDQALAAYQEVIDRYSDTTDPALAEQVAKAAKAIDRLAGN
ncbi:MAG: hypothetical protein ACE5F5_07905, partial [Acidimicrobiia bacterium]